MKLREEVTAFVNETEMNSFGALANQLLVIFVVIVFSIQACRLMAAADPNHQKIGDGLALLIVIQVIAKLVANTVSHGTTRLTSKERYNALAGLEREKTAGKIAGDNLTKERPALQVQAQDQATVNVDAEGSDGNTRHGE